MTKALYMTSVLLASLVWHEVHLSHFTDGVLEAQRGYRGYVAGLKLNSYLVGGI